MRLFFVTSLLALTTACSGGLGGPADPSTAPTSSAAASASAEPSALSPTHPGKFEDFPSQGGNARAYLSVPETPGKHPALIVIQEWWGLNDWIASNADRFAREGYVAAAVDLYRGRVAENADVAHELMRGLDQDRGMADLKATIDRLLTRPDVDPSRIGAIGWCMGGGYALQLAAAEPRLKAVVVNYGHLLSNPTAVDAIKPSLLGNFAQDDAGIPPADVTAFANALKAKGKDVDFQVFPNVGHAFMNPSNKKGYNADAAALAWSRIEAFLTAKLKGGA